MMRKVMVVVWTLIATACFGQQIDLKVLDKLAEKAEEKTEVNMDESMLKSTTSLLNDQNRDEAAAKQSTKSLRGLFVRSYEFSNEGYKQDDLKPLLDKLKAPEWKLFVKSEEKDELTQIWMHTTDGQSDGLLLVSAEKNELTVVNVVGSGNIADFAALGNLGNLGALSNIGAPPKE